jgi:propionate CoA-transferase
MFDLMGALSMSKVIPAADAVELVQSNNVIAVAGYGTNGVPEKILKALGERFDDTHEPRDLTLMFAGGIGDSGDRGLNRIGKEGLLSRVIGGHYGLIPKIENWPSKTKSPLTTSLKV